MALIEVAIIIASVIIGSWLIHVSHKKDDSTYGFVGKIFMWIGVASFIVLDVLVHTRGTMANDAHAYVMDYQKHPAYVRELRADKHDIKRDRLAISIIRDKHTHYVYQDQHLNTLTTANAAHRTDGKQVINTTKKEQRLQKAIHKDSDRINTMTNDYHNGSARDLKNEYHKVKTDYAGFYRDQFYYYELRSVKYHCRHHPSQMPNHSLKLSHQWKNLVWIDWSDGSAYR